MFRIDDTTASPVLPVPEAAGTEGFFTGGNPAGGVPATRIRASWLNRVQELLRSPLIAAGITPLKTDFHGLRQAIRRFAGANVSSVSASGPLTADQAGLVTVAASGGAVTLTLPAASAAGGTPIVFTFVRTDATANALTIQRAGADTIEGGTSLAIPRDGRVTLRSDGASAWRVVGDANNGRSLVQNGWYRLPGGLLVQWGRQQSANLTNTNVVWPVTFPTEALWAGGTGFQGGGATQAYVVLNDLSPTGATFNCFHGGAGSAPTLAATDAVIIYYLALGR
jgi:hypothetical protein